MLKMKRKLSLPAAIIFVTGLMTGTNAVALVNVEASAGQRSQKITYDTTTKTNQTKTVTGSEVNASLLFDPIPVIPISFGLTFQSSSVDRGKVEEAILTDMFDSEGITSYLDISASGKTTTTLYGPMIKIWAPTPYVKPYLKFAYLMGNGVNTTDVDIDTKPTAPASYSTKIKGSSKFSHTGTDIDLGIAFAPAPFVSFFVEYAIHSGKSKITDIDLESVTTGADGTVTTSTTTKDDLTDEEKKAVAANATSIRIGLGVGF